MEPTDAIEDWYNVMDVIIYPSHYEGLSLVLVEAQAEGVPILCSDSVTSETRITSEDRFVQMPLSASASEWAQRACSLADKKRGNSFDKLADNGFDIAREAKKLQRLYLDLMQ